MLSLFDIQVNGFAGIDFQQSDLSGAQLRLAVDALSAHQTKRFFLTLISDSLDSLERKFRNLERLRREDPVCREAVCGYHLEGPWLSPEAGYRGAHDPAFMGPPEYAAFARLQEAASGHIRLLTLAPELPGAPDFIKQVVQTGVRVAVGHSRACPEAIDRAVQAGLSLCTHLGNAVPQQLHRHDNVVQHLLARDELTAFFIHDGIHLPPPVLQNFVRAKPEGKALFTTDCMAAAGAPTGRYQIARHTVEAGDDRVVRLPGQPGFAGSALEPDRGLGNLERWLGYSPELARQRCSTDTAALFGIRLPELQRSIT